MFFLKDDFLLSDKKECLVSAEDSYLHGYFFQQNLFIFTCQKMHTPHENVVVLDIRAVQCDICHKIICEYLVTRALVKHFDTGYQTNSFKMTYEPSCMYQIVRKAKEREFVEDIQSKHKNSGNCKPERM